MTSTSRVYAMTDNLSICPSVTTRDVPGSCLDVGTVNPWLGGLLSIADTSLPDSLVALNVSWGVDVEQVSVRFTTTMNRLGVVMATSDHTR